MKVLDILGLLVVILFCAIFVISLTKASSEREQIEQRLRGDAHERN